MNWDMISAITGLLSLLLALSIEIIRFINFRSEKSKPEKTTKEKSLSVFLHSGVVSIGTGIITFLGLSLSALAVWNWGDYVIGDYPESFGYILSLPSFFAVIIGVILLILGFTTSIISIKGSNKISGCVGLAINTIGCLPLSVMIFFAMIFLFIALGIIPT